MQKQTVLNRLKRAHKLENSADFERADLSDMDLRHLDLHDANLTEADLRWTDLRHSDLTNTYLLGVAMEDTKGLVAFSGIGSRNDTLYVWRKLDPKGKKIYVFMTGCFEGTEAEFRRAIANKMRNSWRHYDDYAAAYLGAIKSLKLAIDAHYKGW